MSLSACDYPAKAYMDSHNRPHFKKPTDIPTVEVDWPCGQCKGCRLRKEQELTAQCLCEMQMHADGQFATLTYNDQNIPKHRHLYYKDVQDFMHRLRKRTGQKLRHVSCAEYGKRDKRPHYHQIIFGLKLDDLKPFTKSKGNVIYTSKLLDEVWGKGYVSVGPVNAQTIAYTCAYLLKDNGKVLDDEKPVLDEETGELIKRPAPFVRRSNRPGLGKNWFDKYWRDVFPADELRLMVKIRSKDGYVNKVKRFPVPKYFYTLLERKDPEMYRQVMEKRSKAARSIVAVKEGKQERRDAKAKVRTARMGKRETVL